ncbi:MAG: GNAT family N-acetyltransferase [Candidatus Eremiobacteraeota bacterium]|nr:GNAT family N-acetyltransferase [Candidatus Eremiobacteraeota bacterium]
MREIFLAPEPMRDRELCLRLLSTSPDQPSSYIHTYHFGMYLDGVPEIVGDIDLRLGDDSDLLLYSGQVGYGVDPQFRGRHLASRSLQLLLPLARRHGFRELWITCDPDNFASRRSCERLGAVFQGIVAIPARHEFYALGLRHKCRYRLKL